MWLILIFLCLCLLFGYFKLYLPLQYWKNKGIPHLKPSLFVGNLGQVVVRKENFSSVLNKACIKFKAHRYFGFYMFSRPYLVILDIELIKQICVKNFEHFTDHFDFLPKEVDTFWKKGLFGLDGDEWHNMRVTVSPTFTSRKMKAMFHLIADCSERFVNYFVKMNSTVTVELMEAFSKLNNDVIASCAFGIECDSLLNENNEFYIMGKRAFDFTGLKSFKFLGNAISPTLAKLFNVKMFGDKIKDFYVRITKEAIDYRKKTGLYRPDVLHLLMEAQKGRLTYEEDDEQLTSGFSGIEDSYATKRKQANKIKITDVDIASQILIFFFGSQDTISNVLSNVVYALVANMDMQIKLRKEIDETLKQCNGKMTYEILFKMKYLDMFISETLRLWPPPTFLSRICVKPFVLEPVLPNEKSFILDAGTEIIIPVYATQRNPMYFKDPEKFDPERFSDENKNNIKPFTYLPFGIGPRHCIGNRFALMVMKIVIVDLLARFEIVPVKKTVMPLVESKTSMNARNVDGYKFGLKPRTDH